jgi:arylesterase/paraoxonase
MPDNLSTNSDGSLLIAGHPHPPTLDKLVKHRRACIAEDGTVPQECWKSNSPTWVARWTAERGLEDLYVSAKEFGSGATAAKDATRNVGIITGLYENGILVWRE